MAIMGMGTGPDSRSENGSSIFWIEELEHGGGDDPSAEVSQQINPEVRPGREAHNRNAHRDCRVERCAGNAADSEGASHDCEADGQAVVGVTCVGLRGSTVKHDIDQSERE